MNPETFDNDSPNVSDDDYFAFVAWLSERTAGELKHANGNRDAQKQALCRYYKHGEKANLTAGELIDFLGISTPSILDMAGYDENEADAVMAISDALTDAEIDAAQL